jgi:hypothetical protein
MPECDLLAKASELHIMAKTVVITVKTRRVVVPPRTVVVHREGTIAVSAAVVIRQGVVVVVDVDTVR